TRTRPPSAARGLGPGLGGRSRDRGHPRAIARRSGCGPVPAILGSLRDSEPDRRTACPTRLDSVPTARAPSGSFEGGRAKCAPRHDRGGQRIVASWAQWRSGGDAGRGVAKRWSRSNPRRIAALSLLAVFVLLAAATGPVGIALAALSTIVGLVPVALRVRRVHLMASLLIPVLLSYIGPGA